MSSPDTLTARLNLGATLSPAHDGTALIDLAVDARAFSFPELDSLADAAAVTHPFQRGSRVGLLGANSAAFVVTLFGIMRAGAVAVPVNTKFPATTLAHVAADAELTAAFVDAANQQRLPETVPQHPLVLAPAGAGAAVTQPAENEAGLVLYTSGSTGTPKGVELSHASQWAMVARMKDQLAGATGIIAAPLYHMNGLLFLMGLLAGGGTVVLMPRFDARSYLQAIHDHRVNVLTGVPTMLSLLLKETELLARLDLTCVAAIQVGSAPLSATLISEVQRHFPQARISNGYGTTEAGAGMFGRHPDGIPVPSLSLGHPQPHVEIRLAGDQADEGVLEVRTPAAMNGYLNRPDATAAKLSNDGWINTGDIMRRDADGFFYFVGRDDDMFNCGGENIYPGEIERLLEADPRVAECCVVPVPDSVKGAKPVAFVVTAPGQSLTEPEAQELVLAQAPAYMHPRRVYFVDTMPLAGTNKIDRKALAALAAEGAAAHGN